MTAAAAAARWPRRARTPRTVVLAIAAAWALAVAAELTGENAVLHGHARVVGGPPFWVALLLFLVAWQAMLAAMMLPSSLPLLRLFSAASARQERPLRARAAFLGGYVVVWTAFGALAFLGDVGVQRALDRSAALAERPWLLAGCILTLAGTFQFSGLKDRCLAKCRQPGPYLLAHYRRGARGAFRLGAGHGIFCVGCCWALMLVMFAAGVAVLWWMAALTALMVYEKLGRHGRSAGRAAGVGLLAAGALLLVHPGWLPRTLGGPEAFAADGLRHGPYTAALRAQPRHALRPGTIALDLRAHDQAVVGARVVASFTMLDMAMPSLTVPLRATGPGTYAGAIRPLAMAGRWGVRLEIAPRAGRSFALAIVDEVAP